MAFCCRSIYTLNDFITINGSNCITIYGNNIAIYGDNYFTTSYKLPLVNKFAVFFNKLASYFG